MAGEELGVHYVSHKVSRVRWRPSLRPGLQASRVFAAGSWDNGADNSLQIYGVEEADVSLVASCPHAGDVTDLRFVSSDYLATTSSSGCLTLFEHQRANNSLDVKRRWSLTPGFVLAALAVKGEEAVVVGESGALHVLDLGIGGAGGAKFPHPSSGNSSSSSAGPKLSLAGADSFSVTSVIYLRPAEILTANTSGQLKLWDLRLLSSKRQQQHQKQAANGGNDHSAPTRILSMNGERVGVESLAQHPTQPHLVAAGGDDGLLTVWDLRMDKTPATLLQGHDSPVWDVAFHPSQPDHLFTCSDDGKVLHWDASSGGGGDGKTIGNKMASASTSRVGPLSMAGSTTLGGGVGGGAASQSPWISSGSGVGGDKKSNVVTSSLLPTYFDMPVNSVDVESDILLCGTDAEAVFTIRNLNIH